MRRKKIKFIYVKSPIHSEERELEFTEIIFDTYKNHIFISGVPTKKKETELLVSIPMDYKNRTYYEKWIKETTKNDKSK